MIRSEVLLPLPVGVRLRPRGEGGVARRGAFNIALNAGPTLAGNLDALTAFQGAVAIWENQLTDPVTVTLDADFQALSSGALGEANLRVFTDDYPTTRNLLFAEALLPFPSQSQYSAILHPNVGLFEGTISATKANLRALGWDMSADDAFADATITFNTAFLPLLDFDPSDGISAGLYDFEAIVVHEIGHALGFVSSVDNVDAIVGAGQSGGVHNRVLDMFRLRPGDGAADFTLSPRIIAPGIIEPNQVFSDGTLELPLSTGRTAGDGNQASHWKADELSGVTIGIMDPTLSTGVHLELSGADLRAFGLIGWDLPGDCNANGIPDACEVDCGTVGGPCDMAGCGTELDCNANSIPDECELPPPLSVCDDNNPCTVDSCDVSLGCVHDGTGVFGPCNDNDACTMDDSCVGDVLGTCLGPTSAATCGDGVFCPGVEACDDGFNDSCGSCNTACTGAGQGSVCGDGEQCQETEQCDDGNTGPGDGCDEDCKFEPATQTKLTASDGAWADQFGDSVCIDGDVAIVGADYDDDKGSDAGAAYIYRKTASGWVQEQKLTAFDGAAADAFGFSVSISGKVAIVGARLDDCAIGTRCGSVYVFRESGGVWSHEEKLAASLNSGAAEFGSSVSISGDVAIVGAPLEWACPIQSPCLAFTGSAFVYRFNGSDWTEEAELTASDAAEGDAFGTAVSIDGGVGVVGTSFAAYVFRQSVGMWTEEQKLTAFDGDGSETFGRSVSISGDRTIVGAPNDDDACPPNEFFICSSGSAYVYRHSAGVWNLEQKLTALDASKLDTFGASVSISCDAAIVGAPAPTDGIVRRPGSAYVYRRSGSSWDLRQKLKASATNVSMDAFGTSVSIDGNAAIVGAWLDLGAGTGGGAAYAYAVGSCGNGGIEGCEQCDHGVNNSDTLADACRTDCVAAHCGDGITDSAEECDDGNGTDGDGCSSTCINTGDPSIPTVSTWGLVVMCLLVLAAGTTSLRAGCVLFNLR